MPKFDDHFMTVTALTDQGILEIRGRDAVKFLQGYCTCDSLKLTENQALYGAITNIQGRVETTFVAILDTAHVLTPLDRAQHLATHVTDLRALYSRIPCQICRIFESNFDRSLSRH